MRQMLRLCLKTRSARHFDLCNEYYKQIEVSQLCLDLSSIVFLLQGNLLLTGDKDQLVMLLDQINTLFVRSNPSVLQGLLRIIPYLSFGELEKMHILVERFKPCCNFDKYGVCPSL